MAAALFRNHPRRASMDAHENTKWIAGREKWTIDRADRHGVGVFFGAEARDQNSDDFELVLRSRRCDLRR